MTKHQEQVETDKQLAENKKHVWAERLREAFIGFRSSVNLADHPGDVTGSLGWEYLHALLEVELESCEMCAGTGKFCGSVCDCVGGT